MLKFVIVIVDKVIDDLIARDQLSRDQKDELHHVITRTHKHQNMKRRYAANQNHKEDIKKRPAKGAGVFTREYVLVKYRRILKKSSTLLSKIEEIYNTHVQNPPSEVPQHYNQYSSFDIVFY